MQLGGDGHQRDQRFSRSAEEGEEVPEEEEQRLPRPDSTGDPG